MAARLLLGIGLSLLLLWAALLATLAVVRPKGSSLREAVRLLPDTLRLLQSIARNRSLEKSIRVRLWLLFAYMAFPIDLVPDFIPVLGYADDAIIVALVLRGSYVAQAQMVSSGIGAVRPRAWPLFGSSPAFPAEEWLR